METPIVDFLKAYAASGTARFHMPGHKGKGPLGIEALDITEIAGADSLYEAEGIIAQSERNAAELFGTGRTLFSTEGSSQCIRAMLYLLLQNRPAGTPPVILAARNAHKAFVYAAALLGFEPCWLYPEEGGSLLGCPLSLRGLEKALDSLPEPPAAVYITSPDYLGGMADVAALAALCHRRGTLLAVDNAHGAYLRFLKPSLHPLDLGADICCDSAHKTLPALTGGAYLHIGKSAPEPLRANARQAMALFGSTSPSYLTLASLDLCNGCISRDYPLRLEETAARIEWVRGELREKGWRVEKTDPLRLTLAAPESMSGRELAERLRGKGMECEYADPDYLVLMFTPDNTPEEIAGIPAALGAAPAPGGGAALPLARGERAISVRRALFSRQRTVPAEQSLGCICGSPTVACPPAIPIAVAGEWIGAEAVELFRHYGVKTVNVVDII